MADPYAMLGVSRNATDDEIKKAYRKKAMELHPDRNGSTEEAKAAFQRLNAANDVLKDGNKRALYDRGLLALGEDFQEINPRDQFRQKAQPEYKPDPDFARTMDEVFKDFFGQRREKTPEEKAAAEAAAKQAAADARAAKLKEIAELAAYATKLRQNAELQLTEDSPLQEAFRTAYDSDLTQYRKERDRAQRHRVTVDDILSHAAQDFQRLRAEGKGLKSYEEQTNEKTELHNIFVDQVQRLKDDPKDPVTLYARSWRTFESNYQAVTGSHPVDNFTRNVSDLMDKGDYDTARKELEAHANGAKPTGFFGDKKGHAKRTETALTHFDTMVAEHKKFAQLGKTAQSHGYKGVNDVLRGPLFKREMLRVPERQFSLEDLDLGEKRIFDFDAIDGSTFEKRDIASFGGYLNVPNLKRADVIAGLMARGLGEHHSYVSPVPELEMAQVLSPDNLDKIDAHLQKRSQPVRDALTYLEQNTRDGFVPSNYDDTIDMLRGNEAPQDYTGKTTEELGAIARIMRTNNERAGSNIRMWSGDADNAARLIAKDARDIRQGYTTPERLAKRKRNLGQDDRGGKRTATGAGFGL